MSISFVKYCVFPRLYNQCFLNLQFIIGGQFLKENVFKLAVGNVYNYCLSRQTNSEILISYRNTFKPLQEIYTKQNF